MSTIVKRCKECSKEFDITDEEQNFFISKGLEIPSRCKECRRKRRNAKAANKGFKVGDTAEVK